MTEVGIVGTEQKGQIDEGGEVENRGPIDDRRASRAPCILPGRSNALHYSHSELNCYESSALGNTRP